MADRIEIASTFTGTFSFICYGRLKNAKATPYIAYRCTDSESGREAEGKMFCSKDALPYTLEKLKALGAEGETDRAILAATADMNEVPCDFDTKENNGYYNADNVRAVGEPGIGGGGGSVAMDDFLDEVFGINQQAAKAEGDGESDAPF